MRKDQENTNFAYKSFHFIKHRRYLKGRVEPLFSQQKTVKII